jgi:hypothetical protein
MKRTTLLLVLLAVVLLVAGGCTRKITNEVTQVTQDLNSQACMKCHGDNNLAIAAAEAQWKNSKHGEGATTVIDANAGSGSCERCHTAEGFIAYVTGVPFDSSHYSSIGCFTCHAPHTNGTLALRVTTPVTLQNGFVFDHGEADLCATCHHSRQNVTTYVADSVKLTIRFGPHHGPQGDMLAGTGGYQYAGYTYTNSPHTNVTPNGCINCHMSKSIGDFLGGHTWTMETTTIEGVEQNLTGCNASTCHSPALTDFNFNGIQDTVDAYTDSLAQALLAAGLVQISIDSSDPGFDTTYVPTANKIVKHKDTTGAVYNYMMISEDRSHGVHNTRYALALLKSSLNYMVTGNPNGAGVARKENGLASAH